MTCSMTFWRKNSNSSKIKQHKRIRKARKLAQRRQYRVFRAWGVK